ncbi:hypothetical protein [Lacticaseibacillus hegangensis]|uniref:Uncharacterized protein n=1 Tax=Lacticaseibacillus hegangensis TaxID=2486010 RepID=A0ABW4CUZ0_9LACO|nr:hypothetical protein [Lacticaseibacillus hegangensis]
MSDRQSTTEYLSNLVVKRMRAQSSYWAPEVNFDKNTPAERRVDFVSFKPYTPEYITEPTSVDLGKFVFYEVKSSMSDFLSGHGLTFYGDENWLVCTQEFALVLLQSIGKPGISKPKNITGILTPDSSGKRLYQRHLFAGPGYAPHRKRPASEILWNIVQAHENAHGLSAASNLDEEVTEHDET